MDRNMPRFGDDIESDEEDFNPEAGVDSDQEDAEQGGDQQPTESVNGDRDDPVQGPGTSSDAAPEKSRKRRRSDSADQHVNDAQEDEAGSGQGDDNDNDDDEGEDEDEDEEEEEENDEEEEEVPRVRLDSFLTVVTSNHSLLRQTFAYALC